ncbi:MAG: hypothetical protein JJ975_05610 [Bacteroidia bacterium]|nr:hypothetical protein [Bacteroidia bacterium]
MKKLLIALILLAIIAVVTNPDEQKHKDAVKRELKAELQKNNTLEGLITDEFKLGDMVLNKVVTRENKHLYSVTKIKVMGVEKEVGYGFLGFVLINRDALKTQKQKD